MEDTQTPSADYIKGFNEGYIIARDLPDVSDTIKEVVGDSERGSGFKDGASQASLEKNQSRYPKWLRDDRLSSLNDGHNVSKDKDTKDLEGPHMD